VAFSEKPVILYIKQENIFKSHVCECVCVCVCVCVYLQKTCLKNEDMDNTKLKGHYTYPSHKTN
jgi:hypothetical protein